MGDIVDVTASICITVVTGSAAYLKLNAARHNKKPQKLQLFKGSLIVMSGSTFTKELVSYTRFLLVSP